MIFLIGCEPGPRAVSAKENQTFVLPVQLEIESLGFGHYSGAGEPDTVQLIAAAAEDCLGRSSCERDQVDVLIAACTYRSEFLMEPAIAATGRWRPARKR